MISKLTTRKLSTCKFARVSVAVVFGLSLFALAQSSPVAGAPAAANTPDAPSAAAAAAAKSTGTKVGTINIEQALFQSNEGRRDFEALAKKFEPKQNELKGMADEIDSLNKQLNAQGEKLNDESRDKLVKQIEAKKKSFDRATQDAQEDFQAQQGEIGNKILTKMAPIIQKYVVDNGYGILFDTSQAWPRTPVIVSMPVMDITAPVVEAYNVQSGVPAPPAGSTAQKPAPKPAVKPPASTPPKQ
ncbi:MAG TPA: OmpH family outer membrane protein [Terriglobales bacterium]